MAKILTVKGWCAVLILSVLPAVGAARGEPLGLSEAMERARGEAREVAAAAARLEAREADLRTAKSYRWPKVSLSEVWMRTDSPAEAFALQLNQERFDFGAFAMADPNDPDPIESATTRLELSVPIFTGGELSGRIEQARLAVEAESLSAVWTGEEAALGVAEAYVRLAQAREQAELLERALETVEAHVRTAEAYEAQGMIIRSELLRAQVERAKVEDMLTSVRGLARVAEAALSYRLAAPLETEWELAPLDAPEPLEATLEPWLAASSGRPDLSAARTMEAVAELEADVQRADWWPEVGLMARYDLTDDRLFGDHGDSTAIMAVARIDLFAGGRRAARIAAAEANREAARADVERFAEGVLLQVRQRFEEARSAVERHRTAVAALDAAGEAERITEARFEQGVVKMIDLLDVGTARREAEMRELVARADAHLALAALEVATGRSLPENES